MLSVEEIAQIKRKKGSLKKKITDFTKVIVTKRDLLGGEGCLERVDILEIEQRLARVSGVLDQYEELCESLGDSQPADDLELFENSYFAAIASARSLVEQTADNRQGALSASGNDQTNVPRRCENVKLPTIKLPKYSGQYTKWLEFRDTYDALIHKADHLTKIQKFYYLKASLEGDAAKIISSMETSVENYEEAWALLRQRYENKKLLVQNHVRSLINLQSVSKESALQLREMLDNVTQHLRALKTLEQPVETWDTMLIFIISGKFDAVTAREWEAESHEGDLPTLEEMKSFLRKRADIIETLNMSRGETIQKPSKFKEQRKAFLTSIACYYCGESHSIYKCEKLIALNIRKRIDKVKAKGLCNNCLRPGHKSGDCASNGCRKCKLKHNSLLHLEKKVLDSKDESSVALTVKQIDFAYCLLSTALIKVRGQKSRVLLDSGSQSNFVTERFAKKIKVEVVPINMKVSGLGSCITTISGKCQLTIRSRAEDFSLTIECLVVREISEELPQVRVDTATWHLPRNIILADPGFGNPGPIDILVGASVFWKVLRKGNVSLGTCKPTLQKTTLGWIIAGPVPYDNHLMRTFCNYSKNIGVQEQLERFWEMEEISTSKTLPEDNQCERHFIENYERTTDGRYIVSLPFKKPPDLLGDSRMGALKRFYALERKLQAKQSVRVQYMEFMREYQELGHMRKIEDADDNKIRYYMPHHGVVNESSSTTKLRVVFDASYPTTSGYSLNNLQHIGPIIQDDLFSILLRFRQHAIAIGADIAKMYRQVLVKPEERCLQRILWRDDPSKPVEEFELNTVTYGTTAASFLAIRSLHKVAVDHGEEYATIIKNDFYVDDLLTGTDNLAEAKVMCERLQNILEKGCFPLRKWISNRPEALQNVGKTDETGEARVVTIGENERTKTLGLYWVPIEDTLVFNANVDTSRPITKRNILSVISQIFDPLGLVGACTIVAKILLQAVWQEKLEWDDQVPTNIQENWLRYVREMHYLNDIKVMRHAICQNNVRVQIHGFADASERAYGACLYLRSEDLTGKIVVRLLCAKSKVAPLKTVTIPRLELCAALVLVNLVEKVKGSLRKNIDSIHLWTDSTIALAWMRTSPNKLKMFVANRVAQIQELNKTGEWRHVASADNPADLISRGVYPSELADKKMWWHGPTWVSLSQEAWPVETVTYQGGELLELRNPITTKLAIPVSKFPVERFSSLGRLLRVTAYCLRFVRGLKREQVEELVNLSAEEIMTATRLQIKLAQELDFVEEIRLLKKRERRFTFQ